MRAFETSFTYNHDVCKNEKRSTTKQVVLSLAENCLFPSQIYRVYFMVM